MGSFAGFHGTDFLQGFEVNDHHFALVFVGDEAAAELGQGQQAGGAVQTGQLAHDGTGIDIHRVDMISPADVEDAGRAVHGEIVPALGAGEVNRLEDVIAGWSGQRRNRPPESGEKNTDDEAHRCSCNDWNLSSTHRHQPSFVNVSEIQYPARTLNPAPYKS